MIVGAAAGLTAYVLSCAAGGGGIPGATSELPATPAAIIREPVTTDVVWQRRDRPGPWVGPSEVHHEYVLSFVCAGERRELDTVEFYTDGSEVDAERAAISADEFEVMAHRLIAPDRLLVLFSRDLTVILRDYRLGETVRRVGGARVALDGPADPIRMARITQGEESPLVELHRMRGGKRVYEVTLGGSRMRVDRVER